MFGLGVGEVLVILVIALIFIGPKKLPELAKNLGKGFREFQNAMKGINTTFQSPLDHSSPPPPEEKLAHEKPTNESIVKEELEASPFDPDRDHHKEADFSSTDKESSSESIPQGEKTK